MSFPITSFLTKEFLEHVFHQKVEDFSFSIATKPGDNYLSCAYRVIVTFGNTTDAKHIFIKSYPENSQTCEFLDRVSLFPTEYWIYDFFIPELNNLVQNLNSDDLLQKEVIIKTAKFYGGNIVAEKFSTFTKEPWISQNFMILEDLQPKGFQMIDRTKGLDFEHCLLTINQLANIHALSWIYKRKLNQKNLAVQFPYLCDSFYKKEEEAGWRPIVDNLCKIAVKVIQDELGVNSDVSIKLQDLFSRDVFEIIRNFFSSSGVTETDAENLLRIKPDGPIPFNTDILVVATHGDCWTNNLLFAYANGAQNPPTDVILVDHQAFREACLTSDLAYFLYSSTRPSTRKQFTNTLLQAYFDKFTKICQALGESIPIGFTYNAFLRSWRRARVFGLIMSAIFMAFVYKPSLLQEASEIAQKEKESFDKTGSTEAIFDEAYERIKREDGDLWKKVIIETVLDEYNEGVL